MSERCGAENEIFFTCRRDESITFTGKWVGLEVIVLSKRQTIKTNMA